MTSDPNLPVNDVDALESCPDEVDILIVGAGPAGLSAALSLQYHALHTESETTRRPNVLLVDALPQGQNESRALVIHARTLEMLESIGCASTLLTLGIPMQRLYLQSVPNTNSAGSILFTVDFTPLTGLTQFPFGLIVAQHITEGALTKMLNDRGEVNPRARIPLLRSMKMVDMKEAVRDTGEGEKKGFLVTFDNGRSIWCRYLVGADGSRSTVRTAAKIPFEDPDSKPSVLNKITKELPSPRYQERIGLADVEFEEDISKMHRGVNQRSTVTFGSTGFCLFAPVKNVHPESGEETFIYRLAFILPDEESELAREVLSSKSSSQNGPIANGVGDGDDHRLLRDGFEPKPEALSYVQDKVDAGVRYIPAEPGPDDLPISPTIGTSPHLKRVVWASTFRIRSAVADVFHKSFSGEPSSTEPASGDLAHVFLIGDAAHIHSPAGGQGMNLGIKDGLECGRAIVEHLNISASSSSATASNPDEPLDRFSTARRKEALQVIRMTKRLSWISTLRSGSVSAKIRDWFISILGRFKFFRKNFAWMVSGLGRS